MWYSMYHCEHQHNDQCDHGVWLEMVVTLRIALVSAFTTATETTPSHYQTQLVFSTLSSSMDSGNYDQCSVTINSNNSLLYVEVTSLHWSMRVLQWVYKVRTTCVSTMVSLPALMPSQCSSLLDFFSIQSYIDPAITNFTIDTTLLSSCTDIKSPTL